MKTGETKELDSRYAKLEQEGFHFWNSYETKPETDNAVRQLHRWGNKVKVIRYPSGVYVVMQKGRGA